METNRTIAVIGGGIVGITAALELQRRGHAVTLIERGEPGRETSYGNTGVLSDASIVISNNPGLLKKLPRFIAGKSDALRYDPVFVAQRLPWVLRFLGHCTEEHSDHAGRSLRALQSVSLDIHKQLIGEARADDLLRHTGWLKAFRSPAGLAGYRAELELLEANGVSLIHYGADELRQIEPGLKPVFHAGILLDSCCSVSSPAKLCDAYAGLFTAAGGTVLRNEVLNISPVDGGWKIDFPDGGSLQTHITVIAAGPWSREVAGWLGYRIPMAWERGYHLHLDPGNGPPLRRAIHDVERGYVMTPQEQGVRVTSGVELAARDAPINDRQIRACVASAREIADFGPDIEDDPWMGRRPSMIDSLPVIGRAPHHDGLWFDFGHGHSGLGGSTGSARLLADLMHDTKPPFDAAPFSPTRFRL